MQRQGEDFNQDKRSDLALYLDLLSALDRLARGVLRLESEDDYSFPLCGLLLTRIETKLTQTGLVFDESISCGLQKLLNLCTDQFHSLTIESYGRNFPHPHSEFSILKLSN